MFMCVKNFVSFFVLFLFYFSMLCSALCTWLFMYSHLCSYSRVAYCDVTGRESRLPLKVKSQGIGPRLMFSFDTLDIQNVFINSAHAYEVHVHVCKRSTLFQLPLYTLKNMQWEEKML